MTRIDGRIFHHGDWVEGSLHVSDTIEAIEPNRNGGSQLIVPGFIDLHNHGGNGFDVMQGEEATIETARFHARHGVVAMAPTTMTAPMPDIVAALQGIEAARQREPTGCARILGAHLEGPWISPDQRGAQPNACAIPDRDTVNRLIATARIVVATIAPEIANAHLAATLLDRCGTRVQIGHSVCSDAVATLALTTSFCGFTHLYNAMSGHHHREGGAVTAALAHAQFAELIVDGHHVSAAAIQVARRAIPSPYCVSDATAASGMPDGDYPLGQHRVVKKGDSVRLSDGTLAGSVLTLDVALKRLLAMGLDWPEALAWVSTRPARYLGLHDFGEIAVGKRASIVALNADTLAVESVWIDGRHLAD
ncbi:amidohydrolase family protein [Gammaproteobacteria bacterium]|nr:amidohydrolase family protein [Gammaproteobacteria bacterium]